MYEEKESIINRERLDLTGLGWRPGRYQYVDEQGKSW